MTEKRFARINGVDYDYDYTVVNDRGKMIESWTLWLNGRPVREKKDCLFFGSYGEMFAYIMEL